MATTARAVRIGTRGSALARAQASSVVEVLAEVIGGERVEMVEIRTAGDRLSTQEPRGGGLLTDGQFTAELERALLAGTIDVAVHSLKDLPTQETAGLRVAAIPVRGDPRDALLSRHGGGLAGLPFGARVGTGSPRRAAQLAAARSDLVATPIRGNVDTRLRRLAEGEYDAIIVAVAGLHRLGRSVAADEVLPLEVMLPAPGQAALAIQVREADSRTSDVLEPLDHGDTREAVNAERELLRAIGGGCLEPLGVLAEVAGGTLRIRANYETRNGLIPVDLDGPMDHRGDLVRRAAARLLESVA